MKNFCLALALFEMLTSPARIFISLFRRSHIMVCTDGYKLNFIFMIAMLPAHSSLGPSIYDVHKKITFLPLSPSVHMGRTPPPSFVGRGFGFISHKNFPFFLSKDE